LNKTSDLVTWLVAWALRNRQRIARILLVASLIYGVIQVWPSVPRSTDVRFDLGAKHREVVELRVGFSQADEELKGVVLRFPEGAPQTVRHEVMLPPGRYDVSVICRRASRIGSVERVIDLPSESVVRVDVAGGCV